MLYRLDGVDQSAQTGCRSDRQRFEGALKECLNGVTEWSKLFCFLPELLVEVPKLSLRDLGPLYDRAETAYSEGRLMEAEQLFATLLAVEPSEPLFWKGLGGCFQRQETWMRALQVYEIIALLSPLDPFSHFHAVQCYWHLGDGQGVAQALYALDRLCLDAEWQERVDLLKKEVTR